ILVLNKADLAEDSRPFVEDAESSAPGAVVIPVSARTGWNLEELRSRLIPRKTYFFLGKSGVGKSSLINAVFGREFLKTREIRASDKRGRHTTSGRDLFLAPNGALLLDAPGLREAALWADEGSVDAGFPEIAALTGRCRFRDCGHSGDPGCAVQEALSEGGLDYRRYESYLEYQREVRFHKLRGCENAQRVERIRWKKISIFQRELERRRAGPEH
ncbi:MAG TPA: ribosome small subunit-dependent GTPase A, partial [Magnetospirillaceae bacterium]|nr:ribosome small subunit-dependent GTPase A [Magnetospirillaceae bacterium]